MKLKPIYLLLLGLIFAVFTSCNPVVEDDDNNSLPWGGGALNSREGCTDPLAYNKVTPTPQTDNGSCIFRACTDPDREGYHDDRNIRQAHASYQSRFPQASPLISAPNNCRGLIDDSGSGGSSGSGSSGDGSSGDEGNNDGGSDGDNLPGGGQEGSTLENCTGNIMDPCLGGYDADPNKKKIPTKIIYLEPTGRPITGINKQAYAQEIIDIANQGLNYQGHQLIKLDSPTVETHTRPSVSQVKSSDYMINNFGSTNEYVLILVGNFMSDGGGSTIGYSPGLRIPWNVKNSIVVMDFNYVRNHSTGPIVVIHEMFHGLGAPHTTHQNGSTPDIFRRGMTKFHDLRYGPGVGSFWNGKHALFNRDMNLVFDLHIDPTFGKRGITNVNGVPWDTRTMMFAIASNYPLFVGNSGFDAAYAGILSVYYNSFVE